MPSKAKESAITIEIQDGLFILGFTVAFLETKTVLDIGILIPFRWKGIGPGTVRFHWLTRISPRHNHRSSLMLFCFSTESARMPHRSLGPDGDDFTSPTGSCQAVVPCAAMPALTQIK
jgi:hypothetical protein